MTALSAQERWKSSGLPFFDVGTARENGCVAITRSKYVAYSDVSEVSELLSLRVPYFAVISSYSTRIQTLRSLTHVYMLLTYFSSFITHQRNGIIELDRRSAKRSKVARRKREEKPLHEKRKQFKGFCLYLSVLRDGKEKERKNRVPRRFPLSRWVLSSEDTRERVMKYTNREKLELFKQSTTTRARVGRLVGR